MPEQKKTRDIMIFGYDGKGNGRLEALVEATLNENVDQPYVAGDNSNPEDVGVLQHCGHQSSHQTQVDQQTHTVNILNAYVWPPRWKVSTRSLRGG